MMKKLSIIFVMLLLFTAGTTLNAAFETWGISVRAKGMGDAMAATHGDVNSMMHNPAGLATLKTVQLMLNYNMPYTGMDEAGINIFNVNFAAPFVNNKLINWPGTLFNLISFGLTKPVFKDGAYGLSFYNLSDELYFERAFSLALSRRLDNLLNTGLNFSIGMRFNLFMHGVSENEWTAANPYFDNGTSSMGFGMDLGVIMHLSSKIHLGLYMNNVIKPNIAINDSVTSEYINPALRYGVTWNVGDLAFMQHLTVAYTRTSLGTDSDDIRAAKGMNQFGFEFWQFNHIFAFRAGYEFGDDLSNLSAGISIDLALGDHEFQLDYAFILPTNMEGLTGSHMVSLVYKIRLRKSAFEFDSKKQKEMRRIEDLQKKVNAGGGDDTKTSGKGDGSDKKKDTSKEKKDKKGK